jgi:hypothetical protein
MVAKIGAFATKRMTRARDVLAVDVNFAIALFTMAFGYELSARHRRCLAMLVTTDG